MNKSQKIKTILFFTDYKESPNNCEIRSHRHVDATILDLYAFPTFDDLDKILVKDENKLYADLFDLKDAVHMKFDKMNDDYKLIFNLHPHPEGCWMIHVSILYKYVPFTKKLTVENLLNILSNKQINVIIECFELEILKQLKV